MLRTTHHPRFRLTIAGTLLVLAAGFAGCGSSKTPALSSSQLSQAAFKTAHGPGYRFALDMRIGVAGQNVDISGQGAIDAVHVRGTMALKLEGKTVDEIIANPYVYVRTPVATSAKPWARTNISVYSSGADLSSETTSNPAATLAYLQASGDVRRIGAVTIRGTRTVHYHAVVDLDRYVAKVPAAKRAAVRAGVALLRRATGSSRVPTDVYVDAQGRVRRYGLQMGFCTPQGKATMSMTMDFYDYGRQTVTAPPPADETTDVTSRLKQQLTQSLKQLSC
jgi:hypothetical protein